MKCKSKHCKKKVELKCDSFLLSIWRTSAMMGKKRAIQFECRKSSSRITVGPLTIFPPVAQKNNRRKLNIQQKLLFASKEVPEI